MMQCVNEYVCSFGPLTHRKSTGAVCLGGGETKNEESYIQKVKVYFKRDGKASAFRHEGFP